ncbi:MAG: hypothetical protein RBS51_07965 [Anaerovoracaceae bacterium]|nr:hypothetical protein [Anaerovoracaceae bacterium]
MNITLSEAFKDYQKAKKFDSVVVTVARSGGSCCRILVPSIRIGEPEDSLDHYSIFYAEGVTFYVTNKLKIQSNISFDYSTLMNREMIEMHGYEITHAAE